MRIGVDAALDRAGAGRIDTLSPVGKLIPTQGRERAGVKCWEALADGVLDAGLTGQDWIAEHAAANGDGASIQQDLHQCHLPVLRGQQAICRRGGDDRAHERLRPVPEEAARSQ